MTEEKKNKAGRPVGSIKGEQRKGRNIRAYDDEWEMIYAFAKIVKKDKRKGEQIMNYANSLIKGFKGGAKI